MKKGKEEREGREGRKRGRGGWSEVRVRKQKGEEKEAHQRLQLYSNNVRQL